MDRGTGNEVSARAAFVEHVGGVLIRRGYHPRLDVGYLRRFDLRRPPRRLAGCRISATQVGGVRCGVIDPPVRHREHTLVFVHGGAYVSGPSPLHWHLAARLSRRLGVRTLLPLYRRAPEAPFPAGYDDVRAVLDAVGGPLLLAGDSAGGGMAAAVAIEHGAVGRLALFSPWLDVSLERARADPPRDRILAVGGLLEAGRLHAGEVDPSDHRISPVHADVGGLPPTMLQIGTRDLFLPDSRFFAARARSVGARMEYVEAPGMFHVWTAVRLVPESTAAFEAAVDFLQRSLE